MEVEFQVLQEGYVLEELFRFHNESWGLLFSSLNNLDPTWHNQKRPAGLYRSVCCIPCNFLNEGTMTVEVFIIRHNTTYAFERDAITFHVFDPGAGGVRGDYTGEWPGGVIRPLLEWNTKFVTN